MSRPKTNGGTPLPRWATVWEEDILSIWCRIFDKTITTESGCWEWQGKTDESGYAHIWAFRMYHNGHRLVWCLVHRTWAGKWLIRHTCDNKSCVNPDHLVRGTKKQNERDKQRFYPWKWKNQHGQG